jgi:molybdopterin synthase sulfur carrier subunit
LSTVKVHYFALLREKAAKDMEEISFEGTYKELYETLASQYGFELPSSMVQVASNDEFTSMDSVIVPQSKVVFIPPVAGG